MRLDISRTTGDGWALRLRFSAPRRRARACAAWSSPTPAFDVDSYEVHQPGAGDRAALALPRATATSTSQRWARDALALALPTQITCRPDCAGLCPHCGANLNEDPEHAHEAEPDPRWAKLSELKFD